MAEKVMADGVKEWKGIDVAALEQLAEDAKKDAHHVKSIKPLPKRKTDSEVPLLDCFFAPCEEGCPIHQDITTYVKLAGEGDYAQALRVILRKMHFHLSQVLSVRTTVCTNVHVTSMKNL